MRNPFHGFDWRSTELVFGLLLGMLIGSVVQQIILS